MRASAGHAYPADLRCSQRHLALKLGAQAAFGAGGTLFDFVFLALLAWSGSILAVIIGYVGLQIASNTAHGPMQGLIPDEVPPSQMGTASGLKNLMEMAGLIAASLAAGILLSPNDRYPTAIILAVMAFWQYPPW